MTSAIPVIDLRAASAGDTSQLGAVRAATEELGVLQVINHGVPRDLISDLSARTARLLSLPRAEKAKLASPHPYRGWRQWPDDFGRLELERFNVAQYDDIGAARAAGLREEYLGLYAHANMWPADDPGLREVAFRYIEASRKLAKRMLWLYAKAQGLREDTFTLGTAAAPAADRERLSDLGPPADPAADEDKLLLLEHADDSVVTILAQEGDYDGLQIQAPGGRWIAVPIIPGALVVFSGSLLTRWTGGRMRAGPAPGGGGRHRDAAIDRGLRLPGPGHDGPIAQASFAPLVADCDAEPILVWDHVKNRPASRIRPSRAVAAWRDGTPYVAELAENSAGR
jgi:flavonol synthase